MTDERRNMIWEFIRIHDVEFDKKTNQYKSKRFAYIWHSVNTWEYRYGCGNKPASLDVVEYWISHMTYDEMNILCEKKFRNAPQT